MHLSVFRILALFPPVTEFGVFMQSVDHLVELQSVDHLVNLLII